MDIGQYQALLVVFGTYFYALVHLGSFTLSNGEFFFVNKHVVSYYSGFSI